MFDALLRLVPPGPLTVGNSAAYYAKVGNHPRPMYLNVVANGVTGTGTLTFTVSHSDDGVNFFLASSGAIEAVALSATPQDIEVVVPVLSTRKYLQVNVLATTITAGTLPDGIRLGVSPR